MTTHHTSSVRVPKFLCALCVFTALFIVQVANLPYSVLAQDNITFTASVDRTTVSTDGYVRLTLSLQGQVNNVPNPELPAMDAFYVVGSSRSQQLSSIPGVSRSGASGCGHLLTFTKARFLTPVNDVNRHREAAVYVCRIHLVLRLI